MSRIILSIIPFGFLHVPQAILAMVVFLLVTGMMAAVSRHDKMMRIPSYRRGYVVIKEVIRNH